QRRLELVRTQQLVAGRLERLAVQGAPACALERGGCVEPQLVRRPAFELFVQPDGLVEMKRTDLEELRTGAVVQPARELRVKLGAHRLAQPSIRDLADKDVLEAERTLARNRGALFADDELAIDERVDQPGHPELGS